MKQILRVRFFVLFFIPKNYPYDPLQSRLAHIVITQKENPHDVSSVV